MDMNEILKKDFKDITEEEWKQIRIEADAIMKDLEEHKEELDEAMAKLPPDFFDEMYKKIMVRIREYEEN